MRPYKTGSRLGLDRSCLRYLMDTLLTFGSRFVYLVKTFSFWGIVSFGQDFIFWESRLVSVAEGLISSGIRPFRRSRQKNASA